MYFPWPNGEIFLEISAFDNPLEYPPVSLMSNYIQLSEFKKK